MEEKNLLTFEALRQNLRQNLQWDALAVLADAYDAVSDVRFPSRSEWEKAGEYYAIMQGVKYVQEHCVTDPSEGFDTAINAIYSEARSAWFDNVNKTMHQV